MSTCQFDSLNLNPGDQFALAGWGDVAVIASGGADTAVAKVLLQGDYAVVVCYVFNVSGTGAADAVDAQWRQSICHTCAVKYLIGGAYGYWLGLYNAFKDVQLERIGCNLGKQRV